MIRMCDTMQTWKWGGFGLGWRGGEERGLPPDGLCGAGGCAALKAALRLGDTSTSHPPRWGSDRQRL